jgi:hypothetical protein
MSRMMTRINAPSEMYIKPPRWENKQAACQISQLSDSERNPSESARVKSCNNFRETVPHIPKGTEAQIFPLSLEIDN